jgi:hypothetical protein
MRLAARGWTDSQIGTRVGLHKNSVNQIIAKQIGR